MRELFALVLLIFVCTSFVCFAQETRRPAPATQTKHVHVEWGRKKYGCHKNGLCIIDIDDGPHCPLTDARQLSSERKVEADATIEMNRITLELTTASPERANEIVIDEDIPLSKCSCQLLGYSSITILKGTYRVSHEGSKFGKIILKVKSTPLDSETR